VLVLFAVGAFALAALCVVGIAGEADSPEGMAALAYSVVGLMLLVAGCGLLLTGAVLLRRRPPVGPAWLVDPVDPALARWWDGGAWTSSTAVRSPATVALAPLVSSSTRRRRAGALLVVGGLVVALVSGRVADATVVAATAAGTPASPVWMVASQLVVPALGAALVGLYLLLTLADDVRPGWHPDPADPDRLRWWDGLAWSDSTAPA
jgi:hypothetical protein